MDRAPIDAAYFAIACERGLEMDADWYYMTKGWIRRKKRVGPISEIALLSLIDSGTIQPQTLLQSSKTKGKWVPMETIDAAMKRWRAKHPETPQT